MMKYVCSYYSDVELYTAEGEEKENSLQCVCILVTSWM